MNFENDRYSDDLVCDLPGEFALRVEGDSMGPALNDGDLVMVRRAALTQEMERAVAVVIRHGDDYRLGRAAILPDGSGLLYGAGKAVSFAPDDFLGPVVAVQHHFEQPDPGHEWGWAGFDPHDLTPAAADD